MHHKYKQSEVIGLPLWWGKRSKISDKSAN